MLRITRIAGSDSVDTLKLEGKLLGPWVNEVRNAYALSRSHASATRLDLSELSFVDPDGAALLRELNGSGVPILACSSFIAELLQL